MFCYAPGAVEAKPACAVYRAQGKTWRVLKRLQAESAKLSSVRFSLEPFYSRWSG